MKKSLGPKTLHLPAPVWLVGTYDADGRPNVMAASWAGICCSQPPCVMVALRKTRYTYGNLIARKAFTISLPSEAQANIADYVGIVSGRKVDKFLQAGLTAVRSEHVDAPYAQEFPAVMECRLLHTLELGSHTQFIGEILDVKIDEDALDERGAPLIAKLKPFAYLDGYRGLGDYLGDAFSIGREIGEAEI
jgi:flavin reductase (DIM6/NTAB) family NADH-FMN oxidoreductase RutF